MLRRGNFINKNVAQMHLNIKNEDWVDNLCAKLDSKMQHKQDVIERNQHLMQKERKTKLFLLQRKEIIKQAKQDQLILLKNQIIRKCRYSAITSQCYLH